MTPGVSSTWRLSSYSEQAVIQELSRRMLHLQGMLGGEGVDVAWMVVRQPSLLMLTQQHLARRLVEMKAAARQEGSDIRSMIERQPALLLQVGWSRPPARLRQEDTICCCLPVPDQGSSSVDPSEPATSRTAAWEHGLITDNDREWRRRFEALQAYRERHGDCHCGNREGDDPELTRWANKQRRAKRDGELEPAKEGGWMPFFKSGAIFRPPLP